MEYQTFLIVYKNRCTILICWYFVCDRIEIFPYQFWDFFYIKWWTHLRCIVFPSCTCSFGIFLSISTVDRLIATCVVLLRTFFVFNKKKHFRWDTCCAKWIRYTEPKSQRFNGIYITKRNSNSIMLLMPNLSTNRTCPGSAAMTLYTVYISSCGLQFI